MTNAYRILLTYALVIDIGSSCGGEIYNCCRGTGRASAVAQGRNARVRIEPPTNRRCMESTARGKRERTGRDGGAPG